jgi:hypothetical protein
MLKRLSSSLAKKAGTGSDADAKKHKPREFIISVTVSGPENVSPVPLVLDGKNESRRALRQATQKATKVQPYGIKDFDLFGKHFEAAVASAFAETREPVTLNEVITKMTKTTGAPKFKSKKLKKEFAWRGFARNRWVISRYVYGSLTTSTARSLPVRRQGTRVYSTESPFLTTWPSRTSSRCMKMSVGPTSAVMKPYLFNSWPLASR